MDRIVAAALEICLTANGNRFQHCCIELRIFFATASNEGKIAARSASVFRAKKFRQTLATANQKAFRFARAFRYGLV
jgi:hypothetical protein